MRYLEIYESVLLSPSESLYLLLHIGYVNAGDGYREYVGGGIKGRHTANIEDLFEREIRCFAGE